MPISNSVLTVLLALWPAAAFAGAPAAVSAGGYGVDGGRRVFIGVGEAGAGSRTLAAAAADLDACSQAASLEGVLLSTVSAAYAASSSGAGSPPDAFRGLSIKDPRVVARWRGPSDGARFSACTAGLSEIESAVAVSTEVSPALRAYLARALEPAFDRLAAQRPSRVPKAPLDEAARPGPIAALAFSPDGASLLSGGGEAVSLWNVRRGRRVWVRPAGAQLVGFSKDGAFAASAGWTGLVQEWDASTGLLRPAGSLQWVSELSKDYEPDGGAPSAERFRQRNVKLFSRNKLEDAGLSAECLDKSYAASFAGITQASEETLLSFACRFGAVEAGGAERRIKLLASLSLAESGSFSVLERRETEQTLTSSGGFSVAVSSNGSVSFGGSPLPGVYGIGAAALSPDGTAVLLGAAGGVSLWDARRRALLASWPSDAAVTALAFSPDGRTAAVGLGSDGDNLLLLRFRPAPEKPVYDGTARLEPFGSERPPRHI